MRNDMKLAVMAASFMLSCGSAPVGGDAVDAVADDLPDAIVSDASDSVTSENSVVDVTPSDVVDTDDAAPADAVGDQGVDVPAPVVVRNLSEVGNINDMWGGPDASVWAVGDDGLVLVLRGGQFVPGPIPPTSTDLFGVGGHGGTVYVVGAAGTAMRWREGAWQDLACPATRDLMSISCPSSDECWAVGRGGTIAHYLDGSWDMQDAGVTWDLFGVLSEDNGGTWIVGAFGSLFELSGSVWLSSQIAGSVSSMKDIYRAPDGTLAVVGSRGTIVMRRNDSTRWEQQLTNDSWEPARDLFAVTGTSATDMWAFGDSGAILHFDGEHWELSEVSGPATAMSDYRCGCIANWLHDSASVDPFLVAGGLDSTMAVFDNGDAAWYDFPAGPTSDLSGVWVLDRGDLSADGRVVFVGDDGLALEFREGRFGLVETGIDVALNAISGGVAVGDSGTVEKVDAEGGTLAATPVISSTTENLVDIFADDDGWVIAGVEGSIFHMDESMAPSFVAQVSGALTSVCRTEAGIFAGGQGGLLAVLPAGESDGFNDIVTFTQSAIRDLAPLGDGRVVAVGDNGLVLVCGAQLCEKVHSEPASFLYAAGGGGGQPVYAAGWAGEILVYDDSRVASVESGTFRVFRGVDVMENGGVVFLAGEGGFAAVLDPALIPTADD